jgi:hypothetical protein
MSSRLLAFSLRRENDFGFESSVVFRYLTDTIFLPFSIFDSQSTLDLDCSFVIEAILRELEGSSLPSRDLDFATVVETAIRCASLASCDLEAFVIEALLCGLESKLLSLADRSRRLLADELRLRPVFELLTSSDDAEVLDASDTERRLDFGW